MALLYYVHRDLVMSHEYILVATYVYLHLLKLIRAKKKNPIIFFDRVLQFIVLSYTEIICCIWTCFVSHLRNLHHNINGDLSSHLKFNLYMVSLTSTMHLIQMHTCQIAFEYIMSCKTTKLLELSLLN